jgi:Matrixin
MRKLGLVLVTVLVVAAAVAVIRGSCSRPLPYRVDRFDERFGLTRQEFAEALRQAEEVWERAVGRDLFVETPGARLADFRQRLESDRVALNELAGTVSGLAQKGNAIAQTHNAGVATFNALYGAPRQFHKGEFDGRQIAVFEFHDSRDLVLLLAHELGHALGIRHVDDSAGVMHAVAGGQPMGALVPTEADMAALRKACRRF